MRGLVGLSMELGGGLEEATGEPWRLFVFVVKTKMLGMFLWKICMGRFTGAGCGGYARLCTPGA